MTPPTVRSDTTAPFHSLFDESDQDHDGKLDAVEVCHLTSRRPLRLISRRFHAFFD